LRDQSVPQVSAHAAAPVRNAAEQSDAEAEYNLGVAYDNGKGVPQDNAQAAAWFRKAAEQGFAEAQYELGLLYAKGQGVPQDYAQAVLWTRKAAEQGDAEAQLFVGLQYAIGQGVSQDYAEAYFWLDVAVAGKLDSADAKDGAKIRDEIVFHLPPADQARVQERVRKWFEDHPAKPQ
jgi:TPR repeat protein